MYSRQKLLPWPKSLKVCTDCKCSHVILSNFSNMLSFPGSWNGRKGTDLIYIFLHFLFLFIRNYARLCCIRRIISSLFTSLLLIENAKKIHVHCLWRSLVHDSNFWSFPKELLLCSKVSFIQFIELLLLVLLLFYPYFLNVRVVREITSSEDGELMWAKGNLQ